MLHHSCPRPFRAQIAATPLASLLYLCLSSVLVTPPSSASDARTVLMADAEAISTIQGLSKCREDQSASQPTPSSPMTNHGKWPLPTAPSSRTPSTGLYQCWYQSYMLAPGFRIPLARGPLCYATSKDGLLWEKPSLGLYDFNGDPDTNIVLVGNGGRSVNYGASVLIDSRMQTQVGAINWPTGISRRPRPVNARGCVWRSPQMACTDQASSGPSLAGSLWRTDPASVSSRCRSGTSDPPLHQRCHGLDVGPGRR